MTILLTTHYIEEADRLCDRIAIIVKGRIIAIDTPDALKKSVSAVNASLEDAFVELTGLKSELMLQEKEGGR
jgi:ABC-2 type transport system ATP-binding protein